MISLDDLQDVAWAGDGSWHTNDPHGHRAAIAHAHSWNALDRLAEVRRVREAIRAMPAAIVFGCSACGKFAFPAADTLCFWCRRGRGEG